jgi:lysophospholipase L1-like esterase
MATMPAERVVVCLGDSNTQGQFSANYVDRLQTRWADLRFVNAGVNGQLAYNVGLRLDDVIAQRPDVVTLLVGTNDVNAQFDARWTARYRRQQRLPVEPTRAWYGEQIDTILTRLGDETDARLAVLDLPPLGEDLSSRMNHLVDEYNATLREVATGHGVPVLGLHERLVGLLPTDVPPPPYRGDLWLVFGSLLRHMILRQSWDAISARNGLTLLTDNLHLNDRAADVVADLIGEFLARG